MEKERRVRPDCINASNPFHVCSDYCTQGSHGAKLQTQRATPAQNGGRSNNMKAGEGRHVDPSCKNASNPFHRCGEYCSAAGIPNARRPIEGAISVENKEGVAMGDNRKVDPRCANASNPFHKCGEYCSKRNHETTPTEGAKSVGIADGNRGPLKMTEGRGVHPKCVNASNPFHKCAEYCFQRIHEAV